MSGGPDDKEDLLTEIFAARRMIVTHDGAIALAGATAGDPGIVMIAGTGSLAFGRNAEGKSARAGGWGYVFGDEGAGFDIVRQALRASLRFEEGWGPPTALHRALIQATGATSASDVQHRFYTLEYPRPRIASLSKLVDQAADEGDQVATDILHSAAQHLAAFSAAVRRQLWNRGEAVRISYVGGVFRSPRVLERFRMLVEMADGVRCHAPEFGPAAGALFEAYRAASLHPKLSDIPDFKS
jgi:N-acetylglucosamine kinase-like BadF-type ATPase